MTIRLPIVAAATAVGQVGLGATVRRSITAHAGCAGIRLPASSFGTGVTWPPALTGLQLHHPGLQLPVLLSEVSHLCLQPFQPLLQGAPLLLVGLTRDQGVGGCLLLRDSISKPRLLSGDLSTPRGQRQAPEVQEQW